MPGLDADRVREVFCEIIDLAPERRAAARDALCDGDAALQARVQALLDAHGRAKDFLDQSLSASEFDANEVGASVAPMERFSSDSQRIGPYTLLKLIGEGGLGSVYLAAQERPIRRHVALKIIRRGMETRQVIARFEVERQALAFMDHPNIARVFDAGETDAGLPYFVMEYIDGLPITRYCDEKQLPADQRLALFVQVCSAIQHAHQKGIIHRDIKPSNVLVSTLDDKPTPKVIDFGISKATEAALIGQPLQTTAQQMVGTPLYMSPEQVSHARGGVDTRSDIYSLGVLLYELLAGATPFDSETLDGGMPWGLQRAICEVEAPAPSARIAKLAAAEAIAARRRTDPAGLARLLRGELDWVVMKAIAKDRERRYGNASSLGADVTRHLRNEPVQAGPPGVRHRAGRFVKRHRLALAVTGAITASLLIGLGATVASLVRVTRAKQAEAREKTDAVNELWNARLLQARAGRRSGQPGQRLEGLRVLAAAAKIRPALALRNEAIGCLALTDLEPFGMDWDKRRGDLMPLRFDHSLSRYVAKDEHERLSVRRTTDHRELISLPNPGGNVGEFFSFSPNGQFLAVNYLSGDVSLRVWNLEQHRPALELRDRLESEFAVDFVREGGSIAVAEAGGKIAVYELPSGVRSSTISVGTAVSRLKAQAHGTIVSAWGPDQVLRIISLETGRALSTVKLPFAELTDVVAWHPDGRRIGFYANDPLHSEDFPNQMYVLDTLIGARLATMQGHLSVPQTLYFSPDGQVAASGAWDETVRLWDSVTGKLLLTTGSYGELMQTSDDGVRMAARGGPYVHLLRSTLSGECRHIGGNPSDDRFRSCDFSADGSSLVCATGRGLRVWDVSSGFETGFMRADGIRTVLFSPDGKGLVASDRKGILRTTPPKGSDQSALREPIVVAAGTGALALSRDGRTAVYGMGDGSMFSADFADLGKSSLLGKHEDFARFVAVSPDGAWAASSTRQVDEFKVWNVKHHRLAVVLPCTGSDHETGAMAFSPDGRWLVTGEPDCYSWWEVETWKLHHRVPRINATNAALAAFSDTGDLLAVAGTGGSILLLDPNTGDELATLDDPEPHGVASLTFSKNGGRLAVANDDPTCTIWDLRLIRRELAEVKLDW